MQTRSQAFRKRLKRGWKKLKKTGIAAVGPRRDVFPHYDRILGQPHGLGLKITTDNVPKGSITWLVPDFEAGSGGHINIFRMMKMLKSRGFEDQHVVIMEPHRWGSAEEAGQLINAAFDQPGCSVSLGIETIRPSEFVMATSWVTAYWAAKYADTMHRCYFVQDFEPYFYPAGTEYYLAEETYRLGLHGITAGSWLSTKLSRDYNMACDDYSFSYDQHLYQQTEKRKSPNRNIFFYARPPTARRCFDLGLLALQKVCDTVENSAVIFAGWDVGDHEIPFNHLNAGTLPLNQLPDLYSQCDVALVLSGTNLSLLPMEVAACGCPLVINEGANSDWLMPADQASYCPLTPDGIADAIIDLLHDPEKAARQAGKAKQTALASDWAREGDRVAAALARVRDQVAPETPKTKRARKSTRPKTNGQGTPSKSRLTETSAKASARAGSSKRPKAGTGKTSQPTASRPGSSS